MATRDLYHRLSHFQTVVPNKYIANVVGTGVAISGYESVDIEISVGTITDGTHAPVVMDSPDNVTFTAVPAANLTGPALANLASNTIQKVGYKGGQPYVAVNVTVTSATTGGIYGATVVADTYHHEPAP